MKYSFVVVFLFLINFSSSSQNFVKQWDYRYGGDTVDGVAAALKTNINNVLMGGVTLSDSGGDKTMPDYYDTLLYDCWIVYVDSNGHKIWDKTLGGNKTDACTSVLETNDHGFLIGGSTDSDSSDDITHKPKDSIEAGDFLLFKIDSLGNKIWDNRYGGDMADELLSMVRTKDGGFILGGWSNSNISGDKTDSSRGGSDYWIVKIDSSGNKIWDKTYGGNNDDELSKIINTSDGGYLLGGLSASGVSGEVSQPSFGDYDYWIVKIDSLGNKLWDKRYGGTNLDALIDCCQMPDSGFLLAGCSSSGISGDKTVPLLGIAEYWLVRIDKNGNKLWDKKYGGYGFDGLANLSQAYDGGFLLGGSSTSGMGGDKSQSNMVPGDWAPWIVKIDFNGNKVWDKTLQVDGNEGDGSFPLEVFPNCYYFIDSPDAGIGGDKSQNSRGSHDDWISKWVYTPPAPVAAFQTNDTVFCANDCISFTDQSTNATSWQWSFAGGNPSSSTEQNPQGVCYIDSGRDDVMLIASNSGGSDTLIISNYISVYPSPPAPVINQLNDTLLYFNANSTYTSIQWYIDSTLIQGATDTLLVIHQSGNYNVRIKNEYECSIAVGINVVGIQELAVGSWQLAVYPSPSDGLFHIQNSSPDVIEKTQVFNCIGQNIFSKAGSIEEIDLSNAASGIYFYSIQTKAEKVFRGKIIKE